MWGSRSGFPSPAFYLGNVHVEFTPRENPFGEPLQDNIPPCVEIAEAVQVVVVEHVANAFPQATEPLTGMGEGPGGIAVTVTDIVPIPQWPQSTAAAVALGGKLTEHSTVFFVAWASVKINGLMLRSMRMTRLGIVGFIVSCEAFYCYNYADSSVRETAGASKAGRDRTTIPGTVLNVLLV